MLKEFIEHIQKTTQPLITNVNGSAFCVTSDGISAMMANLPGVTLPFDYTVLIGPLVIVWYIIGELGSLAEHAVNMGAKVPAWLPKILAAGKSAVDAAGDKIAGDDPKDDNS